MSRPGRRSTRGAAALALAASLAALPLLAGCEPTQAGAAAVVGDRRITVDQLQTATTELRSIVQEPAQITQQLVLGWLITNPYVVQVAQQQGKGVSREDALGFFRQANFTAPGGGGTPSDSALQAVQTAYALQQLTGQNADPATAQRSVNEVLADLKAADVKVNPRYGTFDYQWDPQTGAFGLSPRTPNWIATVPGSGTSSTPATPEPAPSPSAG